MGMINLAPSQVHTELLCSMGFDMLWIDMEHGSHSVAEAGQAMAAAFGRGVTPVVRVPEVADWAVKWVLDQGARGIVFPFVNDAEMAKRAISACRYPLEGHRGYCPDVAALRWKMDPATYVQRANQDLTIMLQIEHEDALAQLDDIGELPGWHVLFVGPMDLSSSYGKLGQVDDPQVAGAINRVREAAHAAGRFAGILATTPEMVRRRTDEGFDFILLAPDLAFFRQALQEYRDAIFEALER
jgi:2-dehydro-3-deoxyglucarate aldolase/4-hydroxy-2-oxoheptanedioate aldolase